MIRLRIRLFALALVSQLWLPVGQAQEVPVGSANTQAQSELDPHLKPAVRKFESPERFFLELRGGAYALPSRLRRSDFFEGDKGPNFGAHLDGIVYRMPKIFYITLGASAGYMGYTGQALNATTLQPVGEETSLQIVPIIATLGVRLDVLPRLLGIPLILAARGGWEWAFWSTGTGEIHNKSGWSVGPYVAAQVALDLDTFEPGGARALDEEWGINHTYVFGELIHFADVGNSLELGTTSWLIGLGVAF